MSKSSFFVLSSVTFLAAAASLQSGGVRLRDVDIDLQDEARADIASVNDDMHDIRIRAQTAPYYFQGLWSDVSWALRVLKADLTTDARFAARQIATLIKTD